MRRINIAFAALIAVIAVTVILAGFAGGGPSGGPYPDEVLSRASQMTQEMSVPGALSGHEYHAHAGDEQLRLSSNPEFVREIEDYQTQIDRMLARTP